MVPFFLQRLDDMLPPNLTGLSQTITETYRNHVWVTPSGLFDLPQFRFIHTVIGADRIIWSVDYPYLTMDGTREFLANLPVSEQDREKIAHLNAESLFTL
jgi:predicted TIM-barrel fold metal-dependent hydrolase